MKKDGNRTDPLLSEICVCIFITTPGWHDYSCVHVCPREGYKLAARCRVIRGASLTWRTPSPAETRRCDAGFGEEEVEERGVDNTCALPLARSRRCRSVAKSRCPSCHFGLQPKLLFAVITNTLQRFPLQTPTARQLQNFCELRPRSSLSVPPSTWWRAFARFDTNQYVHPEHASVVWLFMMQYGETLPFFYWYALTSSHNMWGDFQEHAEEISDPWMAVF